LTERSRLRPKLCPAGHGLRRAIYRPAGAARPQELDWFSYVDPASARHALFSNLMDPRRTGEFDGTNFHTCDDHLAGWVRDASRSNQSWPYSRCDSGRNSWHNCWRDSRCRYSRSNRFRCDFRRTGPIATALFHIEHFDQHFDRRRRDSRALQFRPVDPADRNPPFGRSSDRGRGRIDEWPRRVFVDRLGLFIDRPRLFAHQRADAEPAASPAIAR